MIEAIGVRNYRSIEETELELSYTRKRAPNNYRLYNYLPFLEDGKNRLVPFEVIYGANSSGKSTLISALKALCAIVKNGHDRKYYSPNRMLKSGKETAFTLIMISGGERYTYTLSYDEEAVRSETLKRGEEIILSTSGGKKSALAAKSVVRKEIEGINFFDPFSYSVTDSFSRLVSLSGKKRKECLESVVSLIRKLDLSIYGVVDGGEWKTQHRNCEREDVRFSLSDESEGTRRLFALVSVMLASLYSGSVLVIDEIEVSLHPIVLRALVSLFCDRRYNTMNAQLICSSHNTDLLDASFVNDDEIAIFEKTEKRGSVIERLSGKGSSPSPASRREQYLKGGYSGIPFPYV